MPSRYKNIAIGSRETRTDGQLWLRQFSLKVLSGLLFAQISLWLVSSSDPADFSSILPSQAKSHYSVCISRPSHWPTPIQSLNFLSFFTVCPPYPLIVLSPLHISIISLFPIIRLWTSWGLRFSSVLFIITSPLSRTHSMYSLSICGIYDQTNKCHLADSRQLSRFAEWSWCISYFKKAGILFLF